MQRRRHNPENDIKKKKKKTESSALQACIQIFLVDENSILSARKFRWKNKVKSPLRRL